jgi:NADPH:quinone reductase
MSTKATAARIYEYGEPDVFRFETMEVPDPIGHEVLVRNTVIGLNFVDIYYRRGTLPVPEFPAIIGDEASGVVEAVGPNVTLAKVGDRVAYADAFGAYTTVRLYPEDRLTVIPDGVTDDQAASSLLKGLTARYLLKECV